VCAFKNKYEELYLELARITSEDTDTSTSQKEDEKKK
jgi:hypothetical protein